LIFFYWLQPVETIILGLLWWLIKIGLLPQIFIDAFMVISL